LVLADLAVAGGVSAFLELTTHAYFANTVLANLNPSSLQLFRFNLFLLVVMQAIPLVLAVYELRVARPWRTPDGALLILYFAASTIPILGLEKIGAYTNYWIEFAAATAIFAGRGAAHLLRRYQLEPGPRLLRGGAVLLLAYVAVAVPFMGPFAFPRPTLIRPQPVDAASLAEVASRIRSEPAAVLSEPLDVGVLAGRHILLEQFTFSIFEEQGTWDASPLVRDICNGDVGLLVIDYPIDRASQRATDNFPVWPQPVVDALLQSMTLERQDGEFFLYRWHAPSADAPCGS
jgi:hypothetical protein